MGLLDRFTSRLGAAVGATVGLQSSKGDLDRMNVVAMLRKEFARFRGQTQMGQTCNALSIFIARYGVQIPQLDGVDYDETLTDDQRDRLLHGCAVQMIAMGVVSFDQ